MKALIVGKPLSKKIGLQRVIEGGVLQYRARWWLWKLPKFLVKIIARIDGHKL